MSSSDARKDSPAQSSGVDVPRQEGLGVFDRVPTHPSREEDLSTLAQAAARVGYWTWDLTTGVVWHSEEQYRIHGVAPGGLGHSVEDYLAFVHPDDRPHIEEGAAAAASGDTTPAEYRFVHPDGGIRHLIGSSALVKDRFGRAQQLVGTVQDVTEITRARRGLADALRQVAAYFDQTPKSAYLWKREGDDFYVRRLNKAAHDLWGARAPDVLGFSASEASVHVPGVLDDLRECIRTQQPVTREISLDSERLGQRRLLVSFVPVGPDAAVAHSEDLSPLLELARREEQASAQLAEYFQRVPTPAYMWRSHDGTMVLEASNLASEAVTAGAVTDFVGTTADEMYAGRPDIVEDLQRALAGETFTREMSYEMRSTGAMSDLVVTYVHIPPDVVVVHTRDVTRQRLTEAALRDSHEAARGVLDACTQPIVLCDLEGRILECNDSAGRAYGMSRRELVGRVAFELYPEELIAGRRAAIDEVVRSRKPVVVEDEHDGQYHRARVYPLTDGSGSVERVVVYAEDVTEERRAREALVQSRIRLEAAQRIGHLGHWDLDVDQGELTCSDELYRIFGLDPSVPASLDDFLDRILPEDRERMIAALRGALESGRRYDVEYRLRRPDGSLRFVFEQGEVTSAKPGARTLAGTVLDITQLKQAEQSIRDRETELSTIIEQNPDGICLIVGGRISICNGTLAGLLGFSKDDIEGRALHDLMIPGDRERARARGRMLLEGGRPEPSEYTLIRRDGERVPVEIYGAALEFRGEPALICTLRDVRQRKEAERELAESRDVLRALTQHLESVREQERVQVARDLHDELGSILTALKIDLAELRARDAPSHPELMEQMHELVDQAIEVGRRVTTRLRPGVLDDLGFAAAADWLGQDLERRTGVRARVTLPDTDPDLPEPVATALFRILQEAVTNVIRHAEADSVDILLEADDVSVSLTVSDDGRGFDPTVRRRGGFGLLGMEERVRPFRGRLDVRSAPGWGTTIRVSLPSTLTTRTN